MFLLPLRRRRRTVVDHWLHPLPMMSTTCSFHLGTCSYTPGAGRADGWSPAETKDAPHIVLRAGWQATALIALGGRVLLVMLEEMHCRHMTIQNKANMSCLQRSVVTLWVFSFHGCFFWDKYEHSAHRLVVYKAL